VIADSLLFRTLSWLLAWQQLLIAALIGLLVVSSLAVALSAHETRQLYSQLQVLGQERDNLDSEYEKLLLEQSAWADYSRIDQVSREQLHMLAPTSKSIVVVGR
jgi:cell division protein FtsL|tara:strand:- start:13078 stop:13389 length:312 start_codon:yes stop_codon:yes gene_type:complete